MADYDEYNARRRKRKRRRGLQRILVLFAAVFAILGTAWTITNLIESAGKNQARLTPESGTEQPGSESPAPPPGQETETPPETPVISNGVDNTAWNFIGTVPQTINAAGPLTPDYRMLALPENGKVSMEYFDNVTFIGDSITQGMFIYSEGIPNAHYCAYLGASPRAIYSGEALKRHARLGGGTEIPFDVIRDQSPDNIYILLGTNAMVNMNDESLLAYYEELIVQLKSFLDPSVGIYIQSITSIREGVDKRFDINRIKNLNDQLAAMSLRQGIYFVDISEVLNREDGYIKDEYGSGKDGFHLNPVAYTAWVEYLRTHTAFNPRHAHLYE